MKFNWKLFSGVATITGMIIGAGYLGMPYVIAKSGLLIGLLLTLVIGFSLIIMKLYLGEILLRTKETHQLPGLAKIYLGKTGGRIMFLSLLLGIYLCTIAYLLGEGESLSFIFFGNFDYALYFAAGLWILMSIFVYHGISFLKKGASVGLILVILTLILIAFFFSSRIKLENIVYTNFNNIFVPLGVIMFSLMGFSSIPEAKRVLIRNENLLKKSIIIALLITMAIYFIFTFLVVGYMGNTAPEIATISLGKPFALLGILTMFTAYFGSSMALRDIYRFDLNYKKFKAWFLACFVPFVLFLIVYIFKLADFINIIGFTGAIFVTLDGIMILLMVKKARKLGKRKPEYKVKLPRWVILGLMILLVAGLICELFL
jgi:tyrosine-specific transport protein